MNLNFAKMHGLGNDFVIVDRRRSEAGLEVEQMRWLADRRCGVGFDQLLSLEQASSGEADFAVRIFNADGRMAEQCGNGVRCLARYLERKGLTDKKKFFIESSERRIQVQLEADGAVSCDMGVPVFAPSDIPFEADAQAKTYSIDIAGQALSIGAVSMGNPHAVLQVDDVESAAVTEIGPLIEHHHRFHECANVGFMQITDRQNIRLRVHERGVGETRACGTGACAAMVIGRERGQLDENVCVSVTGGQMEISWGGEHSPVWMRGPATWVFEGTIDV